MVLKNLFFFVIPFLITSCGGGITLKATDGSKINFKSENVYCKWSKIYYKGIDRELTCYANGVRTYLNGYRANYSDNYLCKIVEESGKERKVGNQETFPCTAARKFGRCKALSYFSSTSW